MLSMLRNAATLCIVYYHLVQFAGSERDEWVCHQIEPALLEIFCAISGYLHRDFSLRRMSKLALLFLFGICCNAITVFALKFRLQRGGLEIGVVSHIIWQTWFILAIAGFIFGCTYFRICNAVVIIGLVFSSALMAQVSSSIFSLDTVLLVAVTQAVCFVAVEATEWLDTKRPRYGAYVTGVVTSALPWMLLCLPNLGYVLFASAANSSGGYHALFLFWCYVLGNKLQSPTRFECFREQVLMLQPFFAIAFVYFTAAGTSAGDRTWFERLSRSVRMVFLVSVAMTCVRYTGRVLWAPSFDHAALLAYVSHGLLMGILVKVTDRLEIDVHKDGFCICAAIMIVGVCWVACFVIGQCLAFTRRRFLHRTAVYQRGADELDTRGAVRSSKVGKVTANSGTEVDPQVGG